MLIRLTTAAALPAFAVISARPSPPSELPEKLTAVAISTGGPWSSAVATAVQISIDRWSTSEETQRLIDVVRKDGADALLEALRDLDRMGSINPPGELAYPLQYAQQTPAWEAVNQPRVVNYPYTFIELKMNGEGEGEGKLALATRIHVSADGKLIQLENYAAQPIQLNELRRLGD